MKQPNWTRILTILLVVLASYAIFYLTASILVRFAQALLLFVMGAIVAYILTPLVNQLQGAFRARWLAILLSYLMLAVGLFTLGVFLFTPFVQQSQSLVDNLHNPSAGSLRTIATVQREADTLHSALLVQSHGLTVLPALSQQTVQSTINSISMLQRSLQSLENGTVSGVSRVRHAPTKPHDTRLSPYPEPQTQVPQSYVKPIARQVTQLSATYLSATSDRQNVDVSGVAAAARDAAHARSAARTMLHIMSTTPIVLIRAQSWLDDHNIAVDVHAKFGQAATTFSDQGTAILDNAITILTETANILLNTALILIIAFYFLNDAGNIIHGSMRLVPARYREQAWFFITSLDQVLGGYIRGQLFLSGLAGVLGGGGAAALGVPYPLLIGIVTFLLQSVPVIGPMVAMVPAVFVSLFFMPVVTTVMLFIWFMVFQQIVTNVLGPRINSMAVGIHPLEAILAVLIGFPLGGLLGAFLAVPLAGIVHILVRELYAYFALGKSLPTATVPAAVEDESPIAEPGASSTAVPTHPSNQAASSRG